MKDPFELLLINLPFAVVLSVELEGVFGSLAAFPTRFESKISLDAVDAVCVLLQKLCSFVIGAH